MSFTCDYCAKGSQRGHIVSHAKNRHNHLFRPNLHSHKVIENGSVVKRLLCSGCLKLASVPEKKAKSKISKEN